MKVLRSCYQRFRRWAAGQKGPLRYRISRLAGSPNAFLKLSYKGVIHVGAHDGQERSLYSVNKLKVVWIEAIPDVFDVLQSRVESFPDQKALNALITDRNGERYTFHVSNNSGMSSSILELHQHKDIWPDVHYVRDISLTSVTLGTALERAGINPAEYDVLVMDTQGSELLVLKGGEDILSSFKYIKTEAADFDIYKGCTTVAELRAFLEPRGFRLIQQVEFARREEGGACFELLFARPHESPRRRLAG